MDEKYDLKTETATLVFDAGTGYAGLKAETTLDIPADDVLEFSKIADLKGWESKPLLRDFGDRVLLSWNLTREGQDVPATGDGMMSTPIKLVMALVKAWVGAAMGSDDPLVEESEPTSP